MEQPLGFATGRLTERVLASVGRLHGAAPQFERMESIEQAGVLLALPALLVQGLIRDIHQYFQMTVGFYSMEVIFLTLAFLALTRCMSLEQLRYQPCGEWGRILGLDRCPEVKTLRRKIKELCANDGQAAQWSSQLAKDWMGETSEQTRGFFYVDGHVRVYHGEQTQLPRQYVCREKLCLRAVCDYWVGAFDGNPFFVLTLPVNPGMVKMLRDEIVPRLKADMPHQPDETMLAADTDLPRFTIVFDREGWSPELFSELAQERVAILTYKKNPGEPWPSDEFEENTVTLANGETVEMKLCERQVVMKNELPVREIRQLSKNGHQTAIITTNKKMDLPAVASRMFARWTQENFFKYMSEHFGLDKLAEYATEPIPETTMVINPAWRTLDQEVRRLTAQLHYQQAKFGALQLDNETLNGKQLHEKATLLQEITQRKEALTCQKEKRKNTPRRLSLKDLPKEHQFRQLRRETKHFMDTIKLIAYRAETALANTLKEHLSHPDEARSILRQLFQSNADILPDPANKTLTVRIYPLSLQVHTKALQNLCHELSNTETQFPGSDLKLVFTVLGSPAFPPCQEV